MNIAIFASAFHPHLGGVEELCRQLAHELIHRGHSVIILTNRWPRSLPAEEKFEGLPLYRVPFRRPERSWKSKFSYALTHGSIRREVARILRRHAIDVLHVQCVSSNAFYALEAQRGLRLPLVVTLQGELTMDATALFQRSAQARETLRESMEAAEIVTACSAKTLRDAEEFLSLEVGERGRVVFNAARIEDFASAGAYAHRRPYLFALGRLAPQKGFDVLLRALAASQCPHDLLLAGEGPEMQPLKELSASLGLQERVHLVGRADRARVAAYFKGCEFFVLPSSADEGLPVVCAEAMAAGKAIVATASGGVPEAVVDGVHGLIVPKGDRQALIVALDRMYQDNDFRQRAGRASATRAEAFAWATVTDQYEQVYRDAMGDSSRSVARQTEVAAQR